MQSEPILFLKYKWSQVTEVKIAEKIRIIYFDQISHETMKRMKMRAIKRF